MKINSVHSPITAEWLVANEKLVSDHPILQQMVGKLAEIEKSEGRRKAENELLQFGLSRIAALALGTTGFASAVDLKTTIGKIHAISGEIKSGLDNIARAYG